MAQIKSGSTVGGSAIVDTADSRLSDSRTPAAHNQSATTITTGTLAVARGGTGVTAKTGTGNVVLSASPAFSSNPTATTQSTSNNSTRLATTAFVKAQGYITSAPAPTNAQIASGMGAMTLTSIGTNIKGVTASLINKTTVFVNYNGVVAASLVKAVTSHQFSISLSGSWRIVHGAKNTDSDDAKLVTISHMRRIS